MTTVTYDTAPLHRVRRSLWNKLQEPGMRNERYEAIHRARIIVGQLIADLELHAKGWRSLR